MAVGGGSRCRSRDCRCSHPRRRWLRLSLRRSRMAVGGGSRRPAAPVQVQVQMARHFVSAAADLLGGWLVSREGGCV